MKLSCGDRWHDNDFLFVRDNGDRIGDPMHPDSVTGYCDKFAERYGLKHINPHAFRHPNNMKTYLLNHTLKTIYLPAKAKHLEINCYR